MAGDRIKCWGAHKEATQFAKKFFKFDSVSFSIQLCSKRGCAACAALWCGRLQHFFDIWVVYLDDGYIFSGLDVVSAPSELELVDALDDLLEGHPARLRLGQICALAPIAPLA